MPSTKPRLVLIRGLPGSGKSTMAKAMTGFVHLEADSYFLVPSLDGGEPVYRFNGKLLKTAHARCLAEAWRNLYDGRNVVVANTFTTVAELDPYLKLARRLGITPTVITAVGSYPSIHNVPAATIERMRQRWEPFHLIPSES